MSFLLRSRRAAANRRIIDRLHEELVAAARQPSFYVEGGVPDTFSGRFELLVLHAALVVRRLRALPQPGPAVAQDLVDAVFRHLDPALREIGVGDLAVPKRMKRLAESFLGRSLAYDKALDAADPAALEAALRRNVYGGEEGGAALARYVRAAAEGLLSSDLDALLTGPVRFPDPAACLHGIEA